ncbi:MAG: hypothetical protein F4X72_00910 [Dehalococcoidia bacterium]|nr:hypothetical protein [Dehalococcoidia bacterium]
MALSAEEVFDLARAAAKGPHSGHIDSQFTLEAEVEEMKLLLSLIVAGEFRTPDSAHLSADYNIHDQASVDNDGAKVDEGSQSWSQEWITVGDVVYVLDSFGGASRRTTESSDLPFAPSDLLKFDLLDSEGQISIYEQELDGERVYYMTGPAAESGRYPVLGYANGIDGVVDYWIGAEDHLLRRLEVSVASVGLTRDAEILRLNGFVTLSDYGKSVDIQPPVPEGPDDHGNSPANATEITVGESVKATVDSWLDSDYFRFQGEEGRLYLIVLSIQPAYNEAYGTDSTLFGPDGVTPELAYSQGGGRIVWQATASDTYYLSVESGQEETHDYTLTITLLPEEDDYGDDPSTAQEIGIDEPVEGLIGQVDDMDYFKFTATEGQVYRVDVTSPRQVDRPYVALHGPGGQLKEDTTLGGPVSQDYDTERILWVAPAQGDYYLSVEFRHSNNVGPYTLRVVAIPHIVDDHSDRAANATGLSIGETVGGSLDYEFDLDYFKFNAEEGQGYRVDIDHGSLRSSDLTLYAPDGFMPVPLEKYTHEDGDGYRLLWMAPEGATYHLEVRSDGGATGEYTITVTAVEAGPDDHGNDSETATDLSIGETLQGSMDYEFDLDYFRFMANEGQEYLLHVDHQTLDNSRIKVYASDAMTQPSSYSSFYSSGPDGGTTYRWKADASSEYFVEIESGSGSLGAYTIVIDALTTTPATTPAQTPAIAPTPTITPTPDDCSTGGAVSDAANNPGLVADCEILLAARDTLGFLNWSSGTPISDWDGITVGGTPQRVEKLQINNFGGLSGRIPAGLGGLSKLTHLDLHANLITGSIPAELGNLKNLVMLRLWANDLSGPIPTELGKLSNLEYLDLGINRLSGAIPPELGNLSNLDVLSLYRNRLSGTIPPELGRLSRLRTLWLENNLLTGIPPELGRLSNLGELHLDDNRLAGSIPPELGNMTNLWRLRLSYNQLTGSIPEELGSLRNLRYLGINGNVSLTGCLPTVFRTQLDLTLSDLGDRPFCDEYTAPESPVSTPSGPDLFAENAINRMYLPLPPGLSFSPNIIVRNQGNVSSARTTLRYYRSDDSTITTGDTEVGNEEVEALEPYTRSWKVIIGLDMPTTLGTYYYGACVDAVPGESNTANNCSTATEVVVRILNSPPQLVGDVNDRTVTLGESFQLDLSSVFSEPDGEEITDYGFTLTPSGIISGGIDSLSGILTLTAIGVGDAIVAVDASDIHRNWSDLQDLFVVTVVPAQTGSNTPSAPTSLAGTATRH